MIRNITLTLLLAHIFLVSSAQAGGDKNNQAYYNTSALPAFGSWTVPGNWQGNIDAPLVATNSSKDFFINILAGDTIIRTGTLGKYENKVTITVHAGAYLKVTGDILTHNHLKLNIAAGGTLIVLGQIEVHTQGNLEINGDLQAFAIVGHQNNILIGSGTIYISGPKPGITGFNTVGFPDSSIIYDTVIDPLPVELLAFNAWKKSNIIELHWSTASETNNMGFEIQHLEQASSNWEIIGWVEGYYNHNGIINYSFKDNNPRVGINYYRLKQIDYDGIYKYYGPVAVVFDPSLVQLDFKVHKTPSRWYVGLPDGNFRVEVYDLSGRKVFSSESSADLCFPAPGKAVIVRIISGSHIVASRVIL
jgi:hypothetical protein